VRLRVTINGATRVERYKLRPGIVVRSSDGDDRVLVDGAVRLRTTIDGGAGNDTLAGGGVPSQIFGGSGDDSINGGAGNDWLNGGDGNDRIFGGAGADTILGGDGNDIINGGDGNDRIDCGAGNDAANGGAGNDYLNSGAGNDSLSGADGSDRIVTGLGKQVLRGGGGDDSFSVSSDTDPRSSVDGGAGTDDLVFYGDQLLPNLRRLERAHRWVAPEPEPDPYPSTGQWPWAGPPRICFLTTAVVHWAGKRDDCRELTLLRRFRDTYMRGLPEGPDMIRDYYRFAPRIVRAIEGNALSGIEWPRVYAMVQTAIRYIVAGRNAAALRIYSAEYLRLKNRYLPAAAGELRRGLPVLSLSKSTRALCM
jgi:hypothetical protein